MMQAAAIVAKGSVVAASERRVSAGLGAFRKRGLGPNNMWMPDGGFCCGRSPFGSSLNLGVEMARVRTGVAGIFRSREKARWVRIQVSSGSFASHNFCLSLTPGCWILLDWVSSIWL